MEDVATGSSRPKASRRHGRSRRRAGRRCGKCARDAWVLRMDSSGGFVRGQMVLQRWVGPAFGVVLAGCVAGDSSDGTLGRLVVDPEEIHVIGTSEVIAHIEDVMATTDGAAWVLNSTDPFLVLLSAQGETLRVAGERGAGPGELSWPTTLVRDPSTDAVYVYDVALGRLALIDEELGVDRGSPFVADPFTPIRLNSYEYLWTNNGARTWIDGTEEGIVFAEPMPGLPWIFSLWSTDVVRLRRDGERERLLSTEGVVGDPAPHFPGAQRFLPYPIWTACPGGSLALYDPGRNVLRRFSSMGEELGIHELPPERGTKMSAERVFTTVYPGILRNRLMASPPGRDVLQEMFMRDYENRADEFSTVFPEYVHLDCSAGDILWLQLFDSTSGQLGRGPRWLRVTVEGRMGPATFPPSFRPMRFDRGRIWGMYTGESDVEYVAWTELREQ